MISFSTLLIVYLTLFIFSSIADLVIDLINDRHVKRYGNDVPIALNDLIDGEKLSQINAYNGDLTKLTMVKTIISKTLFLFIILSGLLPWLAEILKGLHFIPAGLIFFAMLGLMGAVVDLPFEYHHIFRIEERYGFNKRTLKIWISDLLKSLTIAVIIGTILLSALLLMIRYAGNTWWIWAWAVFFSFQLLMTVLYPTVIAPIFNKFTAIENHDLAKKIEELSEREGLAVKGIFQMDEGRRSRHTNAYFTGLGKVKRIVLYDTLLEAHNEDEILAILAHEIGHLKKNHIKKQLVIIGTASIVIFYFASKMITWETMYSAFGFSVMPVYVGLFLITVLWEPFEFFLSPVAMAISRRFEHDADRYASRLMTSTKPFIEALKKLARDNLSNLRPHPIYVKFNYSHPPLLERISKLEDLGDR